MVLDCLNSCIYWVYLFQFYETGGHFFADSGRVLYLLQGLLESGEIGTWWLSEHLIRKAGHFTEYTLLGILLFQWENVSGLKGAWRCVRLAAACLIPLLDETIQLFTQGRSGQISDVWLDLSGILFGTLLAVFLFWIRKHQRNRTEKMNVKKLSNGSGI